MAHNERAFHKQKNLLDLKYQTYLNYFNITAISFITAGFTAVWAFLLQQIGPQLFASFAFIWVLSTVSLLALIHAKASAVYSKIELI